MAPPEYAPTLSAVNASPSDVLSDIGEAAVRYARQGMRVLPLLPRDKRPPFQTGPGHEAASSDPDVVAGWFRRYPVGNVGMVPAHNDFVVVDCDSGAAREHLATLGALSEPNFEVRSGRDDPDAGHLWFRHPGGVPSVWLGDGLEVKSRGMLIVLPPSLHRSGRRYEFVEGNPLAPRTLPPKLLEAIMATHQRAGNGSGFTAREQVQRERWGESERHQAIVQAAARFAAKGISRDETYSAVEALVLRNCVPPLPKERWSEIAAAVNSAFAKFAGPNGNGVVDASAPGVEPFSTVRILEGDAPEPPAIHVHQFAVDRDINLIAAGGGHGKSTLLLAAAVSVVLDRPLFGTLTVHRAGPVLLVLPEDGEAVVRMLLDALIEGYGLSANDRASLREGLVMIPDAESVDITRDTRRLQRTAKDHDAVMLIGDPLRTLIGGADENDNAVAGVTYAAARRDLCRGADLSIMLAHHNRKPGKDAGAFAEASSQDVRGASGWVFNSRLVLGVTKKQNRIVVIGLKGNRVAHEAIRHELDLVIEADPENQARWLSCTITDANAGALSESLTPGRGRALNPNELAALSTLNDKHEPGKRFSWSHWLAGAGLNPNTFKSVKDRLLDAGLAAAVRTGKKTNNGSPEYVYELTLDGREVLATGRPV